MELKPCPFCGGTNINIVGRESFYVRCDTFACHITTPSYGKKESAVNKWNNRPSPWQPAQTAPKNGELFLAGRQAGKAYFLVAYNPVKDTFLMPGSNTNPVFDCWMSIPD